MCKVDLLNSPKFSFPVRHIEIQTPAPKFYGTLPKFFLPKTPQTVYAIYNSAGVLLGLTKAKAAKDFIHSHKFDTLAYGWAILNKAGQRAIYALPKTITFLEVCSEAEYKKHFARQLRELASLDAHNNDPLVSIVRISALLDEDLRGLLKQASESLNCELRKCKLHFNYFSQHIK